MRVGDQIETGAAGESGAAPDPFERSDPPLLALTLWPNRSLTRSGGTWLLGLAAAGMTLPLIGLAGTHAAWGMLPFLVAALALLYWALRRNTLDGRLSEEVRLWPDVITVVRREPRGRVLRWHANPFWVRAHLYEDAVVEKYLTLEGGGREIEVGAFLSPWERESLYDELSAQLRSLRP
jgi:uncharacterized membrane protein